jgi:molecular chaperone DnaK
MVADAQQHRDDDRRLRELTDARNELDSAAYQVERRLGELAAGVPVHEKARAETLIADARQAIQEQAPLDRLRSLTSELQQIYQSLAAAGSGSPGQGPSGGGPSGQGSPGQAPGDDDVIDAEFTTHD